MVEIRRGTEISGGAGPATGDPVTRTGGDRLPWLEPVEDEDDAGYGGGYDADGAHEGGGYGGVLLAAIGVLAAIALVTAGIVWFRHHRAATADIGEVIHPEPGPYKISPPHPGGLDTAGVGAVAAGTSAGEDIDSVLDLSAVPETPVITRVPPKPGGRRSAAPSPSSPPAPQVAIAAPPAASAPSPAASPPEVAASGAGGAIQLGAFSTEAKAKAAWKGLSARFAFLKEMTPVVSAVDSGEAKLFRLRATGGTAPAARLCAQLRVAGETCAVVGG